MARFMRIANEGSQHGDIWINIDTIVSMWYDEEENKTYIFSCDDPNEHFTCRGNIISSVLNTNNDITMHDKLVGNYIVDKLKSTFSMIISKLDVFERWFKRN